MHASERDEFKGILAKLCAGFNVPITKAREDAYWSSCGKMTLAQFSRCVDHAIGDEYAGEDMPTTRTMWKILREFRAPKPQALTPRDDAHRDHLTYYANRLLLRHMMTRMGLGSTATYVPGEHGSLGDATPSDELQACRRAAQGLVDWFTQPVLDGDELATPQLFIGQFIEAISAVSDISPTALREWQRQCDEPDARVPFPKWMARSLEPHPQGGFAQQALLPA